MSTAKTWQIDCASLDDTLAVAKALGQKCRGGEVLELVGDLGSGKTAFVRGLAEGMGSGDSVSSPSFTISNQYQAGKLTLHHFDFYRLQDPGLIGHELSELAGDSANVVAIEWPDIADSALPARRLKIQFTVLNEGARRLNFSFDSKLDYLVSKEILTS